MRLVDAVRAERRAEEGRGEGHLTTLAALWDGLPLLGMLNLAVMVAALPAMTLSVSGWLPLVPLSAAVPVGAVAAGGTAICLDVGAGQAGGDGTWRTAARHLRAYAGFGLRTGVFVGGVGTVAVMTALLRAETGAAWLLGPLFLDGVAVSLGVVALPYVLVLGVTSELRGRRLWLTALAAAARAPAATLATLAILAVAVSFTVLVGPGLLLALPGPLGVLVVALLRSVTAAQGGDD